MGLTFSMMYFFIKYEMEKKEARKNSNVDKTNTAMLSPYAYANIIKNSVRMVKTIDTIVDKNTDE